MDQLELVFRLLVHLQFMYFQYNVYLSIVVRINIYSATGLESRIFSFVKTIHLMCISILPSLNVIPYI